MNYALAVDIGGTKTAFGIMDSSGRFAWRDRYPTPTADNLSLMDFLIARLSEILNGHTNFPIKGIGIGTGGVVDPGSGRIAHATPLLPGWMETPVRDILQKEFQLPVKIDNDGNMAALGEYLFGKHKGASPLVFISIGTGIGGGVVIDGKVHKGKNGAAMNIGHIAIEKNGTPCNCGRKGCLEAYASGRAIEKAYEKATGDSSGERITAEQVFQRMQKGDAQAREVIGRALNCLALGIDTVIELFDPDVVVLGGGVSESLRPLLGDLRKKIKCAHELFDKENFFVSSLGNEAGLAGAGGAVLFDL